MAFKPLKTFGGVAAGLAALTMIAASTQASADDWRRHRHRDRGNDAAAAAIVGGIVGLAIGSSLNNDRRGDRYYDRRYYGRPAYGYDYGYRAPPPRYYGYDYGPRRHRSDCWTTRDYDRYSGSVYERTVCR
ncbi:hypothetical protein V7S57_06475 [Caulobacter sp. CCNWLY153]|jgi:hypothetical protein|uniref:17 kDa surface antigen n=1 Tax=Caulobacter radicis TaxID=2172650 RepID=A0A2T9JDL0_9CAUL|nr:hypothetical protein [Caulobacter radicis]PVM81031.1 hypothetical protein DDF65_14015 [Caulobacter radicis]PVM86164.1 hypothetical protein DDF62_18525 [Caulobacter radicis]